MRTEKEMAKKYKRILQIVFLCLCLTGMSFEVRAANGGIDSTGAEESNSDSVDNMMSHSDNMTSETVSSVENKGLVIDGTYFRNNGTIQVEKGGNVEFGNNNIDNGESSVIINKGSIKGNVYLGDESSFIMEDGSVTKVEQAGFGEIRIAGGVVEEGIEAELGIFEMTGGIIKGSVLLADREEAKIINGTLRNEDGAEVIFLKGGNLSISGGNFYNGGNLPLIEMSSRYFRDDNTLEIGGNAFLDGKKAPVLKADMANTTKNTVIIKDGAKLSSECGDGTVVVDGICDVRTEQPLKIFLEGGAVTNEAESGGAAFHLGEAFGEKSFSDCVLFELVGTEVKVKGEGAPVVYMKDGSSCSEVPGCRAEYRDGYTYLMKGAEEAALMLLSEGIEAETPEGLTDVSGNEIDLEGAEIPEEELYSKEGHSDGELNLEEKLNFDGESDLKEGLKPDGEQGTKEELNSEEESDQGTKHNADGKMPPTEEALPGEEPYSVPEDPAQKDENAWKSKETEEIKEDGTV